MWSAECISHGGAIHVSNPIQSALRCEKWVPEQHLGHTSSLPT